MELAVLNLVLNARDASHDGGRIKVRAYAAGRAPATQVALEVEDFGSGMDQETLARAREPFFTTKGVGKGTGLGLSVVHGLAEESAADPKSPRAADDGDNPPARRHSRKKRSRAFPILRRSTGELDVLLTSGDPDDDAIPDLPATPRTRPGDIWKLGDHLVACGDSRDAAFIQMVLGEGAQVDAAFLDPPYNVRINGHANARGRHREFAMASGEMSDGAFRTFLAQTLGAAAKVSRDGAVHFVCMDWRHMADISSVGAEVYGELLNLCVWNKSNVGMGSLYRSKHELIFVYKVGSAFHFNAVELGRHGRNRVNVWDYTSVNSLAGSRREDLALHPTVKPTALVADAIQDVTRRGDRVLDVFLGSGTTLIASQRCGRRFCGIDIDPAYVDVAIERWTAMTGKSPRLVERWKQ